MRYCLFAVFIILAVTCTQKDRSTTGSNKVLPNKKHNIQTVLAVGQSQPKDESPIVDSSIVMFNDTAYRVHLHIFDSDSTWDESRPNAALVFTYHRKIVFKDSLFCIHLNFDFQDFNNDGVKDMLVLNYTGGRANPTYHLYVINNRAHMLTRIKGFEKIPNPALDTVNNIITGNALLSQGYIASFYRINYKNKLVNLGHSFNAEMGSDEDSIKYEKAYQSIIRKWGRK